MDDRSDAASANDRAQEMLNDIIQSLDEGLSLYDADLRFIMRNSRRYGMFGQDVEEVPVGRHLSDVTRDLASSGKIVLAEGETPQMWSDRIVKLTKLSTKNIEIPATDGHTYYLSVHRTKLGGYLLVFKDMTEQLRAEKAQRDADLLLRKIVETCPTTFLVSRVEDGKIIYFPPASRERYGGIETTLEFFLDPADRQTYLNALLPTGAIDDYRVQFRRRDGSVMQGVTSARVTDYKGEDVIVSSTRDITDELALQAELREQREIAHQNEKLSALGELLAGVAHELNNPLSIVVGYSLMLQDKIEDPKQRRQIERIGLAAERCAKIVKTFLAMARQKPANLDSCSLNDILQTALDVAAGGLKASGVEINVELDPDLPPVTADADQMAQVFANLITNAEHAMADCVDQRRLTLTTEHDRTADEVAVHVRDSGPGIPEHIQARIFEPFFTTKEVGTGTGVGLAFSHRIVAAHEGELTIQSRPGEGATFTVRLRVAEEPVEPETAVAVAPPPPGRRTVLVIDDEAFVTDLIRDILEYHGYLVEAHNDPVRALDRLQMQSFDAILSDMKMPGMDGKTFLDRVRETSERHADRIAFVTGDTMSPQVEAFLEDASIPCLEKPVAPADLVELVGRLCAGRGNAIT